MRYQCEQALLSPLQSFFSRHASHFSHDCISLSSLSLVLLRRILPALLCSAIVYPTVQLAGISGTDSAGGEPIWGPVKAGTFVLGLCLTNLAASAVFSCIGIVCEETMVAVLTGVLYCLFSLLFSGFLTFGTRFSFLSYFSILHYFFELVMSNELLGRTVTVNRIWPGDPGGQGGKSNPITGYMVVHDNFKFNTGWLEHCARIIQVGENPHDQKFGCWFDLYMPAIWFIAAVLLSIVLLKYCARDPH